MNARGSLLAYQSFSRVFPRLARLPSVTACKPFDRHQNGGSCLFPTSTRSFTVGSRLLSLEQRSDSSQKQHPHSTRTVFVFGFKSPTTEAKLQEYFAQFGEIESFVLPRKFKNLREKSRGFALVKYKSEDDFEKVLFQTHVLDGHDLDVEKSRPNLPRVGETCFVQVRNLDSKTRKEDLQEHFSKYGSVKAIDWPTDSATNSKHEFCFVQFSLPEEAEEATKDLNQRLGGMDLKVLMSNSKKCKHVATTNSLAVCVNATPQAVAAYFGKFGKIKSISGKFSPRKPKFLLVFEDESSVKKISLQTHFIENEEVFPSRDAPNVPAREYEKQIFTDDVFPNLAEGSKVIPCFRQFGKTVVSQKVVLEPAKT